jgi:hypothetical protein
MADKNTRPDFGGDNLSLEVADNILTVRIDLDRVIGTTSGGNQRIASTGGNVIIGTGGTKLGLNVYRKVAKADKS